MDLNKLRLDTALTWRENEVLAPYTTYRIGGPARYFVEVATATDLRTALQVALDNQLNYFILGNGSNILVNDAGFDGLVIHLLEGELAISGTQVTAFAGNNWSKLARQCLEARLEGFEFSANIPGTVGGMVRGNAGAYGQGVGDFVRSVDVLILDQEVGLRVLTKDDCNFSYRESIFKKNSNWIIASVTFELLPATHSVDELLKKINDEHAARQAKQPLKYPSAGSSFKNVEYTESLSQYKDWEKFGKLAAGRFIEMAGLKGKTIGGAKVSDEHANFIINYNGQATASDVVQLISLIKMKVRDEYGVELEEEIQYVGFN